MTDAFARCAARHPWQPAALRSWFAPYHLAAAGDNHTGSLNASLSKMRNASQPALRAEVTIEYGDSGEARAAVLFARGDEQGKLSGMVEILLSAMRVHAGTLQPMLRRRRLHVFFQLRAHCQCPYRSS